MTAAAKTRKVTVVEDSGTGWLAVYTPYHAEFVRRAKALGGQWYGQAWHFGPHLATEISVMLDEIFPGWDRANEETGGR